MTQQERLARLSQLREWALRISNGEAPEGAPAVEEIRDEMIKLENEYRVFGAEAEQEQGEETETREEEGDGEEAEIGELVERSSMTRFLEAATSGRDLSDGPELELMQATGCDRSPLPGVVVPWQMFEPSAEEVAEGEQHFADAATNLQSVNAPFRERWIPRIFARRDVDYLRVRMPAMSVGDHAYYTFTSSNQPSKPAVGAAVESVAASATLSQAKPRRYAARYTYYVEDLVRFREYEGQLRMDLRNLMSHGLDREVLSQIWAGIAIERDIEATSRAVSDTIDIFGLRQRLVDAVDGLQRAYDAYSVRLLMPLRSYGLLFTDENDTAGDYQFDSYSNVRVTTGMPAAKDKDGAVQAAQDVWYGVGDLRVRPAYEVPVWQGVSFIRDHVTQAASGIVALTATMLYQFVTIDKKSMWYGVVKAT